ncbi:PEP-CTERM sorting domain-containing protein [Nitrosomonas sp.]|uniref:PEP-CTERM sorting domain-containing protein n=1 Tax=Nitrosomonas sp. TaxID=42353 RepID=UPI0025D6D26A|nr:PEP-CTERM sorting domain-containing protein [Nitrosomonas sp.]MCC6916260.1 PEP-CTERM sorting domain-containing protein [Nitrosomonas sp.]
MKLFLEHKQFGWGIRKTAVLTAAIASLGFASASWAVNIELNYQGFVNGSKSGNITTPLNGGVGAGEFKFNVLSGGGGEWNNSLQAFCIDINHWLVTGRNVTYDIAPANLTGLQLSQVSWLFDNHFNDLGTNKNDAAFQLTLWEIFFEGDNLRNLSDGTFKATTDFDGARALADTWLTGSNGKPGIASIPNNYVSDTWEFYKLTPVSPMNNQALLTWREKPRDPREVSEPGTLLLLSLGLGAVFFCTRRYSNTHFSSFA